MEKLNPTLRRYLDQSKKKFNQELQNSPRDIGNIANYCLTSNLGAGSFGEVFLATKKEFLAVKIMTKEKLTKDQIRHVLAERQLLAAIKFPFIVQLINHWEDDLNIYLAMELVPGGELWSLLQRVGKMEEASARFYLSQVVLCLQYLHNLGILYRDLKLENLLIDSRGYLKLIDFGFSKLVEGSGKSWTLCGTPDYLAPEVILAQGYGQGADWWAFGVLTWELVAGKTPWVTKRSDKWRQIQVYEEILQAGQIGCPSSFSYKLSDLVIKLLERRSSKRLGVVGLVEDHEWFETMDWEALWNKTIPVPYLPSEETNDDVNDNYYSDNRYQDVFKSF